MIISFWSPFNGKGSVTTTTVLTSLIHYRDYERDSNLITTVCKDETLNMMFEKRVDFTKAGGIEGIESLLVANKLSQENLPPETFTLAKGRRLDLLPWKKSTSDMNVLNNIYQYLTAMDKYNTVYFDLGSGSRDTLKDRIIEKSSAVVMCLPQDTKNIYDAKKEIQAIKKSGVPVFVVVTQFDSGCKLSIKTMSTLLGLSKDEIFYVPYVSFIKDDLFSGDMLKILSRIEVTPVKFMQQEPIHKLVSELSRLLKVMFKKGVQQ